MSTPPPVGVGLVGTGFLAATRARCYRRLGGLASLVAVASARPARAREFAARHQIPQACETLAALLERPEVAVVDLCVPNHLHRPMAEAAAAAGRHVVCTKPLTAYVGQDQGQEVPAEEIGRRDRKRMLKVAVADARAMVDVAASSGVQLFYGENWIYAPAYTRALDLLRAAGGSVVEMYGWESHSGSHSPYARLWKHTGGGALLRLGSHPIGAMLHLKHEEGLARSGRPLRPVAVTAEVGEPGRAVADGGRRSWLLEGPRDVETWGCVLITFEDGSRGTAHGSDNLLGGMQSRLRIQASNCHLECNLSPQDALRAYAPEGSVFADEPLLEKLETAAGWSTPLPDADWSSGHEAMCRDFVAAVAEGRPARSTGGLGLEVVRVVYAAYLAASEGRRVELPAGDDAS